MRIPVWRLIAVLGCLAAPAIAHGAEAGGATLSGTFRDWFVYSYGEGETRVCYALSQPRNSDPANVERGEVAFLVSTWPGANKRHEPSVVPGYPYREGEDASVRVQIGGDQFDFGVIRNEGDEGGAWMENAADEARLLESMKGGATMVVTGTSARGTLTRDTYSLAGITAALDNIAANCN